MSNEDIVRAYRARRKRNRRIEREKAESLLRYKEQQTASEYSHMADLIVRALSKLSYNANSLNSGDIVQKVSSGAELEYYYRWCCDVL